MIPKFRAWEKNMNEMIPVDSIDFVHKTINIDSAWRTFNEIILMRSTDLFDKSGVEIFEGDVVVVLNSRYTVFYDDKTASFRLKPHDKRWHTDYMSNYAHSDSFEVVGNVYQMVEATDGTMVEATDGTD